MLATTQRGVLCFLAFLAPLFGQVEGAPQVTNVITESVDYANPIFNIKAISNTDIGDASQGATTAFTAASGTLGNCHGCVIDGLLGASGNTGAALLPGDGSVLEIFLDTSVNSSGYNITELVNTTGWNGSSRTNHQYVVALHQVGGSYTDLINVQFPLPPDNPNTTPPDVGDPGVQLTINDDGGGNLGVNIDAVRFTFNNDNAGTSPEALQEVDISGVPGTPLDPATEFQWSLSGLGDWNSSDSWTPVGGPGTVPNSNEQTAVFGDAIQASSTVTADVPMTVNRIQFDNATNTYAVAGLGGITLAATGVGGNPSISALGTHEFQTKVELQANTVANVAAASTLSFNNALNLNGNDLTLSGAGTANINNVLIDGGGMVNLNAGTLGGGGEISANVDNSGGTVAPGNSPGILTIDGNYTQGASGTLALEIGGLVPGEDHDKLAITGTADLNGTVAVELTGGFTPANNDTFDVLDFDSFTDSGFQFDFSSAMGDGAWDTSLFSTAGSLCFGSCPGGTDFDGSGFWDLPDLNLVLFNWQQDEASLPVEWLNQRPDTVGLESLNLVLFNWQQASSLAVVPEPATMVVFVVGAVLICGCTRTRRNRVPAANRTHQYSGMLFSLAILALVVSRADAALRITAIQSADFFVDFTVSDTDIADVSQGAIATYEGQRPLGGCDEACTNDGLITLAVPPNLPPASTSDALFPDATGGDDILTIEFDTSVMPGGYSIASLVNVTGWTSKSRTGHQYTVSLRQVGSTTFTQLIDVASTVLAPVDGGGGMPMGGVQLTIDDDQGGLLGTGIDAIQYVFTNPDGSTFPESYREFDVFQVGLPPATLFTWDLPGLGNWHSSESWQPAPDTAGTFPNSNEHTAVFSDSIQAPSTVTADAPITLNRIQFDNATNTYALAGVGGITLAAPGDGGNASISAMGTHEFQTKVDLQANTVVDVAAASTLTFNNALNLNGNELSLAGAGTANVNSVLHAGGGTVNLNAGTLGGGGEVGGSVNNSFGTVAPGSSPGILTIDGNYTQGAGGTLALEIGGLVPGEDHDKLAVTGTADLNGTVAVELTGGFTPANNDTFDVLDFDSFTDSGFQFDFSSAMGDGAWDTSLFSTAGSLCFGSCPGGTDFDGSGIWDLPDLNLVLFSWQQDEASLPVEWVNQRPATVGLESLNLVLFNWQQASSLAVVPEPASLVMLLIGVLLCCGRRTNRI